VSRRRRCGRRYTGAGSQKPGVERRRGVSRNLQRDEPCRCSDSRLALTSRVSQDTSFSFNRMNWRWSSFQFVPRRSHLFIICYRQESRPGQFVDSSFRSSFLETSLIFCNLQTPTPPINYLFFPRRPEALFYSLFLPPCVTRIRMPRPSLTTLFERKQRIRGSAAYYRIE
jgi:hypothetical protein